jgi:hypothetical protein
VTVDGGAERSKSFVSFSFPYPTGVTEGTDADTIIKKQISAEQRSIWIVCIAFLYDKRLELSALISFHEII